MAIAPKRTKGRAGHLRRHPARDLYEYRVTIGGRTRSFYAAEARDAVAKADQAIREARFAPAPAAASGTLSDYLAQWLDDRKRVLKPATWKRYDVIVRRQLVPALGALRLDALTPARLDTFYRQLADKTALSATSIRHVHVVFGTALQAAVKQGRLTSNPARAVEPPRARHRDKVILSREECERLLDAARGDRFEALYVLAVTTGMRLGELLALNWRDVDLRSRTVTVNGSVAITLDGETVVGAPKTDAAKRTIPLPARASQAIATLPRRGELLFPTAIGGPMRGTAFAHNQFHPMRERAGLSVMPFHDLRHTAATHMLEDGTPPHVVSAVLGHATVGITLTIYAHVTGRLTSAALASWDARYPASRP